MKSTTIKALITILIFTLSSCSNLLRKTEEKSESLLQNYVTAEISTTDGGNWATGFDCPSVYLSLNGGGHVNQGAARIQGAKLIDDKNPDNKNGLLLEFTKPIPNSLQMKQVAVKISGNKFYIPWRYFKPDFKFTNPFLNNKYIQGDLVTDAKTPFNLKINFPYALFTTYVSDDNGNQIRERINKKATETRRSIHIAKEILNVSYPAFKSSRTDIMKISLGAKVIDEQIMTLKANINDLIKNNDIKKKTVATLSQKHSKQYIEAELVKNQIAKINQQIIQGNADIKALADSVSTLLKSKENPKPQLDKEKKTQDAALKKAEEKYNLLKIAAPERMKEIIESKNAFASLKANIYQKNLDSFKP